MTKESNWKQKLTNTFDVGAAGGTSIIGEIAGGLIGTYVPGVTSIIMSYKQKRFENNVNTLLEQLKMKETEFEKRLSRIEKSGEFVSAFELVMDYVIEEPQEGKIQFMVNGLLQLSEHEEIKEDFILLYYDTLRDLRFVDIGVMRFYYVEKDNDLSSIRTYEDMLNELGVTEKQYTDIREKLVRMGLLSTKRDQEMDKLVEDVNEMKVFLEKTTQGKKAKLSSNKLTKRDRHVTSKFGRDFINFFVDTKLE